MDFEIFDFWRFLPVADKERLAVLSYPLADGHIPEKSLDVLVGAAHCYAQVTLAGTR